MPVKIFYFLFVLFLFRPMNFSVFLLSFFLFSLKVFGIFSQSKSIDFDKTYRVTDSKIFIHSGDRLLEEFKSDNAIRGYKVDRRYLYGNGYVDNIAAVILGSRYLVYYHQDRQQNVVAVTDWKKRPIETYQYSPYGERVVNTRWRGKDHSDSQYGLNFGFTGRYFDEDTDLYYFRARYYDTEQGRFISRDPAGYVDGMSLYNGYFAERFALDPSGEIVVLAVVTAAIVYGAFHIYNQVRPILERSQIFVQEEQIQRQVRELQDRYLPGSNEYLALEEFHRDSVNRMCDNVAQTPGTTANPLPTTPYDIPVGGVLDSLKD